jgi:OOP family OmpA-OmpF porin
MDRRAAAAAIALLTFAAAPASACIPPPPIVFFEAGSAELDEADGRILDAAVLEPARRQPELGLRYAILGHGDRAGTDEYNLALSRRRAEAVRDYLVGRGLRFGAIERIEGLGETRPLLDTADGIAEPQNRRAEVLWYSPAPARPGC